jgi:acetoin utilization deacetylase AcuC-like enzyme
MELCDGRVVAVLEGGYSLDHLPLCNLAIIEELAGLEPSWERDPIEIDVPRRLGDDAKRAVDAAARLSSRS